MHAQEQGEQPISRQGEGKAPVGRQQQAREKEHQQVFQQPVLATQGVDRGPQPGQQEYARDQCQLAFAAGGFDHG
ncbi:hypothetical protein D3C71_2036820 [compost metagenome]